MLGYREGPEHGPGGEVQFKCKPRSTGNLSGFEVAREILVTKKMAGFLAVKAAL